MGCPYKWYSLLVYILLQLTRNLGANLEITIVFHRETTTAALMFLSCVHPKQAKKAQSGIVMIYIPISLKEKTHYSNIQIMRFFLKWNWYAIKHDKHVLAIFLYVSDERGFRSTLIWRLVCCDRVTDSFQAFPKRFIWVIFRDLCFEL